MNKTKDNPLKEVVLADENGDILVTDDGSALLVEIQDISKAEPLKPTVPKSEIETEEERSYSNILQSKATNALTKMSKRKAEIYLNGSGHITQDGVQAFLTSLNKLALDFPTHRVLDILTLKLTNSFPYGDITPEGINKYRGVMVTLDEYMSFCGLKDRKSARDQLNKAITTLSYIRLEWDEIIWEVPEGKKRKQKRKRHYNIGLAGKVVTDATEKPVKNGIAYFSFSYELAEYLSHAYVMPYPIKLLTINYNANRNSYYIGRKLAEHHNMNIANSNANVISVRSLLAACPDLPTYEEIMQKSRNVTQKIREPFEKDLIALVETYGVLKSQKYCINSGKKDKAGNIIYSDIPDDQRINTTYSMWENWLVKFELANYPDQTERIAKIEDQRAKAKASKEKKATSRKSPEKKPKTKTEEAV